MVIWYAGFICWRAESRKEQKPQTEFLITILPNPNDTRERICFSHGPLKYFSQCLWLPFYLKASLGHIRGWFPSSWDCWPWIVLGHLPRRSSVLGASWLTFSRKQAPMTTPSCISVHCLIVTIFNGETAWGIGGCLKTSLTHISKGAGLLLQVEKDRQLPSHIPSRWHDHFLYGETKSNQKMYCLPCHHLIIPFEYIFYIMLESSYEFK